MVDVVGKRFSLRAIWILVCSVIVVAGFGSLGWFWTQERSAHAGTKSTLAATQTQLATTESELASTHEQLDTTNRTLSSTRDQLAGVQRNLADVNTMLSDTVVKLDAAKADISGLGLQLAKTIIEKDQTAVQLSQTQKQVQDLQVTNVSLRNRVQALETEQSKYYVTGFYCTGSMEPYITCADEAVFKRVFATRSIQVGTVISFRDPPGCGSTGGVSTAHRVVEIRIGGGSYLYRTQGDNVRAPDPCWVPLVYVNGVLALVRKNARPENVIDTTAYRIAQQELDSISDQIDAVDRQYDATLSLYLSEDNRLCGYARVLNITCWLSSGNYAYLLSLESNVETLRVRGSHLVAAYDSKVIELKAIECRLFKLCG